MHGHAWSRPGHCNLSMALLTHPTEDLSATANMIALGSSPPRACAQVQQRLEEAQAGSSSAGEAHAAQIAGLRAELDRREELAAHSEAAEQLRATSESQEGRIEALHQVCTQGIPSSPTCWGKHALSLSWMHDTGMGVPVSVLKP